MKIIKKNFTALLMICSLASLGYSISAVAQGGSNASFGRIAVAIESVLELLTTAKNGIEGGVESESILKVISAARQESKEITGDNFGMDLQIANDRLKQARRAIKLNYEKADKLAKIDAAITAYKFLDTLKK